MFYILRLEKSMSFLSINKILTRARRKALSQRLARKALAERLMLEKNFCKRLIVCNPQP
jgi:hypothetical protein